MATATGPSWLPFCLSFKRIRPDPEHPSRSTFYGSTGLRNPPTVKEAFLSDIFSPLLAWTPGSLQPVPTEDRHYIKHYKMSSVYWCPSQQTYQAVDFDCTQESVTDRAQRQPLDAWERLKFEYQEINGQCVSVIGHRYPNDTLAAVSEATWMHELIPTAHQCLGSPCLPGTRGPSLLAGDLSLLMALAALSSSHNPQQTIEHCFRPPTHGRRWNPHAQPAGARERENGVVMHILYDQRRVTEEQLANWEAGTTHPILE